jgi:hypothetical protein
MQWLRDVRMSFARGHQALALAICCVLLSLSATLKARERLAVLVLAPNDALLSDNLTEVAIASLAELNQHELVGMRELETNLNQGEFGVSGNIESCISDAVCLKKLGNTAGVRLILIGRVAQNAAGETQLEMSLADVDTAQPVARSSRVRAGNDVQMIAAVQHCIAELFNSAPHGPTPVRAARPGAVPPGPEGSTVTLRNPPLAPPLGNSNLVHAHENYLAYGTAALAVLSFSAAALTGAVASGAPQGHTRLEAQSDAERRQDYAHITNGLLVTGAVFGAVSACAFVWHW